MDANKEIPDFSELPIEMILNIFRYLGHADRQSAGATCKRWYAALCFPEMNENVMAHFSNMRICDDQEPVRSFNATDRPINTFLFEHINVGNVPIFLNKIAKMARFVIFKNIEMSENKIRLVMRPLECVETLTLIYCTDAYEETTNVVGTDIDYERSLQNIKGLVLRSTSKRTLFEVVKLIPALKIFEFSRSSVGLTFANAENANYVFDMEMLVPHLPHLRELNFSQTDISGDTLVKLNNLAPGELNLRRLRLAYCKNLGVGIFAFLETQPQLYCLDLTYSNINNYCLKIITSCLPMLQCLHIAGNRELTDDGIITLKNLKQLRELNMSRCRSITHVSIAHGFASSENHTLKELNLSATLLTFDAFSAVAENLNALRKLDVSYCAIGVDDLSVQLIIKHLPNLTELYLSGCTDITDSGLTGICGTKLHGGRVDDSDLEGYSIAELRHLQLLDINDCHRITDASLQYGLKLKSLRTLYMWKCEHISSRGLQALVENAPYIEQLHLTVCVEITDEAVEILGSNLKRLRLLKINGRPNLPVTLTNKCKALKILQMNDQSSSYEPMFTTSWHQFVHSNECKRKLNYN